MTEEPAVRAWMTAGPARREPERIEVLKRKRKSLVCRLVGAADSGASIVAKRSSLRNGRMEHRIYEEVLPRIPVASIRSLGLAADADPDLCWIFLEDVGDVPCISSSREHRALLSAWMSVLHVEGAAAAAGLRLPDRGPQHHLDRLRSARAQARRCRIAMPLRPEEEEALALVDASLGFVASRWERIERICDDTPETFVHGDLKDRNIRVRESSDGPCLLPFDWELAGWGPLAIDLAKCPDLDLYADRIGRRWPDLTRHRLGRLQDAGHVFRSVSSVDWELERLNPGNVNWSIQRLRSYLARLEGALARIGIGPS